MGVSRQAISNWERSESLPDTANLIRLAEYYGVTLDELIKRPAVAADTGNLADDGPVSAVTLESPIRTAVTIFTCVVLSAAYYVLLAQPLLQSTVDDLTQMFGLTVSPTLAVLWVVAEVVFVLLPFVLIAVVPVRLPHRIWLAPLTVFMTPLLINLSSAAMSGASVLEYSGIGGALMSTVVIKVDVLSLAVGCLLVDLVRRHHAVRSSI
jgi:hypothetical protein